MLQAALNDLEELSSAGNFESAVITAATEQAERIIEEARLEGKKEYDAMLMHDKADDVAAHKTQIMAKLRRKVAGAKQDNMKKLLVYRKQLVNGLFAQCKEELEKYVKSDEYATFIKSSIEKHSCKLQAQNTVFFKQGDSVAESTLKELLPNADFCADASIKIGGAKLRCGRLLFDETLDERLREQRTLFLQRCNLHVSTAETEQTDE